MLTAYTEDERHAVAEHAVRQLKERNDPWKSLQRRRQREARGGAFSLLISYDLRAFSKSSLVNRINMRLCPRERLLHMA